MEWLKCKDFPEEMSNTIQGLDLAIRDIEGAVAEMTSIPLAEAHSKLTPLERSNYDTAAVYAVTSLFWVYMKTKGIDPKANGLPKELERVKGALARAKQISDKALAPRIDVSAAKRFVRSGLWQPNSDGKNVSQEGSSSDRITPPAAKRSKLDIQQSTSSETVITD